MACVNFTNMCIFFQWGAAYCVRGGPEKEKKAMEVCELLYNDLSYVVMVVPFFFLGPRL